MTLAQRLLLPALFLLPLAPVHAEPSGESAAAPSLEQALDVIRAEDIETDLWFLASDQLEGRDSPSSGLRIAARFLRARLERLGWKPGARDGFFHVYHLQQKRLDEERTSAALVAGERVVELELGVDYGFSARGLASQEREAALVWCGGGTSEELEGLELEGKLALIDYPTEGSWFRPYRGAQRAGAAGVVWATPEGAEDNPLAERWDGWLASMRAGRVGWPASEEPEERFNSLGLSASATAELFELAGGRPAVGTELSVRLRDHRAIDPNSPRIPLENVCGWWPGSDPELRDEVIVLSAHYDHVGVEDGEIYNGADDNGSGTTALLSVAEALAEHGPMRRSVLIVWVSAEEKGLLGARAWTEDPWLPDGARAICNINIDMVGRNAPDELHVTPSPEHEKYNRLTQLAEEVGALEGFGELKNADAYYHRSDHAMFEQNMDLPVCFLFSDVHEDYHQPTDTVEKVDYDKVRRVARLVVRMIAGLQDDTLVFEAETDSPSGDAPAGDTPQSGDPR